ncbi:MAG TPA: hypothetical protein PLW86_04910 [Rhodocyclaceae bacterium]|nr:hypothetical protein [Rhodocyclaceae bacterium]
MQMTPRLTNILYGIAGAYAFASLVLRETGIIFITVIGFGIPALALLLMEWVVPPLVAIIIGLQSRWSFEKAAHGLPLVLLFGVITPSVPGRNVVLPANVPWLAEFPASTVDAASIIQSRLIWWGGLFLTALVLGRISRAIHPPLGTSEPKE